MYMFQMHSGRKKKPPHIIDSFFIRLSYTYTNKLYVMLEWCYIYDISSNQTPEQYVIARED